MTWLTETCCRLKNVCSLYMNCLDGTYRVILDRYLKTWNLFEKLPVVQPRKNVLVFYGTRRFIIVFTRALNWSLSWARSIHSIPSHHIWLRSILILSTHLCLVLHSGLFWLSHQYPICMPLLHSCYMPCPSHPPWLDHSNYVWRGVQVINFSLCNFLKFPVTSSLFGPNILLSILFSNTLNYGYYNK
jgi:hypothetical protein